MGHALAARFLSLPISAFFFFYIYFFGSLPCLGRSRHTGVSASAASLTPHTPGSPLSVWGITPSPRTFPSHPCILRGTVTLQRAAPGV